MKTEFPKPCFASKETAITIFANVFFVNDFNSKEFKSEEESISNFQLICDYIISGGSFLRLFFFPCVELMIVNKNLVNILFW